MCGLQRLCVGTSATTCGVCYEAWSTACHCGARKQLHAVVELEDHRLMYIYSFIQWCSVVTIRQCRNDMPQLHVAQLRAPNKRAGKGERAIQA